MGWTSYHAGYYKNGKIDRKAECDAYFMEGLNAGYYRVEKSAMIGSVYYAAVTGLKRYATIDGERKEEEIPAAEQKTFAVVFLTQTNTKDYFDFFYKDMDETMLPYYFDCPKSILDLLSPTDNESALEWRRKCRERIAEKKSGNDIGSLPIGTVIEFEFNGETERYIKHAPAYQFKTAFWYNPAANQYIQKKHIPSSFRIVSRGA